MTAVVIASATVALFTAGVAIGRIIGRRVTR